MNEQIWSIEFVKENPELAVNAIKTLQLLVQDLEEKIMAADTASQQTEVALALTG